MNKSTITLRRLIDSKCNINVWQQSGNTWQPQTNDSDFVLFDSINPYPLFFDGTYTIGSQIIKPQINGVDKLDNTYRSKLNTKIINHYADYKIGFKTPNLFYHYFNNTLNEKMPEFNNQFRILWEYFSQKLPYGYFEHEDINGSTKNNYNSDTTLKKGDINTFDWSGGVSGNNANDPTTTKNYVFDTPQNLQSLDVNDPAYMSGANTNNTHEGERYYQNGRVIIDNQVPQLQDGDDNYPTGKTKFNDDKTENRGYDSMEYVNRYNEKYGYNSNDIKTIMEYSKELSNIDLEIIKSLRDCFLYIY